MKRSAKDRDEEVQKAARKLAATAPPGTRDRLLEVLAEGLRQRYPNSIVTINPAADSAPSHPSHPSPGGGSRGPASLALGNPKVHAQVHTPSETSGTHPQVVDRD